ncbi:MAG: hypothetical protein ACLFSQ_05630 [Candidatus Zixiibacteriota bacterium]
MKKLKLIFIIISLSIFAQEKRHDSLETQIADWMKIEPIIACEEDEIELNDITIDEKRMAFLPIVFFEAKSAEVSEYYDPLFERLAEVLDYNPDIKYTLKGYYSKSIDDILAPIDCIAMAERRIESVRSKILAENRSAVRQVIIDDGYDMSKPFFEDTTDFDMRVAIDFKINNYRPRSILLQDNSPFVRISYRDIIKSIYPRLDSLLLRNPDLYIQIHANGNPWDTPLSESYTRLKRIKDFLEKKLDRRNSNRITMLISPSEKQPKNIDLKLVFAPLGADLNNRNVLSRQIDRKNFELLLNWNHDIPMASHSLQIYQKGTNERRYMNFDEGSPLDRIKLNTGDINAALLPGLNNIYLAMTDIRGRHEISGPLNIELDVIQYTYRSDMIGSIYGHNAMRQYDVDDCILYRIAYKIIALSELSDKMMNITVSVSGDSGLSDTTITNSERADYTWKQLSAILVCELGLKDTDDLQKWFEKRSVAVFLEPSAIEIESDINNPNKQLFDNRSNIIIEMTSE